MPVSGQNYFKYSLGSPLRSDSYGMLVTGAVFGLPERVIEKISIPGMNGDLVRDYGKYSNITVQYECEIPKNFVTNIKNFNAAFGHRMAEYGELTDSYESGWYRLARFMGTTNPNVGYAADSGKVLVQFDCKPQIFKDRDTDITVNTTTTVANPTGYEAWPMLFFTHGGTATFTNSDGTSHSLTVDQTAITNYSMVSIDCERKICGSSGFVDNLNQYVSGIFPSLKSGNTVITVSNGAVFTMWPRWWKL